eukprot:m.446107 g.446107  ORF g.446107 m.446107 type:complete len:725 (+) comp56864_c0_seq10:31-2205(+)
MDSATNQRLASLVGRVVANYFPAYGTFLGVIKRHLPLVERVVVEYEDDDEEELSLAELEPMLQPPGTRPPQKIVAACVEQYHTTWPPPSISSRLVIDAPRIRKPSQLCLQSLNLISLIKDAPPVKRKQSPPPTARPPTTSKQIAPKSSSTSKGTSTPAKSASKQQGKPLVAKKQPAASSTKETKGAQQPAQSHAPPGKKRKMDLPAKVVAKVPASPAKLPPKSASAAQATTALAVNPLLSGKLEKKNSRALMIQAALTLKHDLHPSLLHASDRDKDEAGALERHEKRWSGPNSSLLLETLRQRKNSLIELPTQESSLSKHTSSSSSERNSSDHEDVDIPPPRARRSASPLAMSLSLSPSPLPGASTEPRDPAQILTCEHSVDAMLNSVYRIVQTKLDITSGVDGFGITGTCTKKSFEKLFDALVTKCEFGSSSSFMDLGHGMGRPSLHVAALHPHIKHSFGTEFNPELYKQSMRILAEVADAIPCFKEQPRVYFMDANIRDLNSMNPFSHVYFFNLGMPDDVVDHTLELFRKSSSVRYVIMYPHRSASLKVLRSLGQIVHCESMRMTGRRMYEAVVVKLDRKADDKLDHTLDQDIESGLQVLADPLLYHEYLEQLGNMSALEAERVDSRQSRKLRHTKLDRATLSMSPLIDVINQRLLTRVARSLGVSVLGDKLDLLLSLKRYVPVTFSLSLFVVGEDYTEQDVKLIVQKLLSVRPARRQPEAN